MPRLEHVLVLRYGSGADYRSGCAADQVRARLACLGSRPFRDGSPHAVAAFGTKLVVFADTTGALHVLDAIAGIWAGI